MVNKNFIVTVPNCDECDIVRIVTGGREIVQLAVRQH
jgi:hypothetical protein